jgi:CHAT domain-containing protein
MGATSPGWIQTLAELSAAALAAGAETSGTNAADCAGASCQCAAVEGFFQGHPELRNPQSVELLHEEVLRVVYADLGRAGRLARAAQTLAFSLNDEGSRAAGLRAMGHVSYAGANYEVALRYYREAIEILEALGREHEVARTLMSGLQSQIYLGRYDEAYAWAARAGEIFERSGDELRLARLASNVGNILYRQDRYAEALESYKRAYATLGRLGEHRDVAAVLSNMAVCNISLSRFTEAMQLYTTAREYCQNHELSKLVAGADYNVAYLHYLQGDFLRAIELYKSSREHYLAANDAHRASLCDLDEAEIYLELNLNSEAGRLAAKADASFLALGMPYERGKALVTQAMAASRLCRPKAARRFFSEARNVFAGERNTSWPALIDLYRAMLLERDGPSREAVRLCRRAYRVLANSTMPGRSALAELLLSRLLLKDDQVARAREMCNRAAARLETAGTPWLRFHAHFVRGQVEERSGNADAAFEAYRSAHVEIERLRSRLWGDEARISFLKDKLAVYESLVKGRLADRRDPAKADADAFLYIQRAKSRSLADLISRPAAAASENEPSVLDREIEEARRDLNTRYRRVEHLAFTAQSPSAGQLASLQNSVRECEGRLARLVASLPEGSAGASNTLSLEEMQSTIPAGAMLLEYYVVKGLLYVCLLTRTSLEIIPLTGIDEVRTRMRLLRFQLGRFRIRKEQPDERDNELDEATANHLSDLYYDLIAPIRSRLKQVRHLIFAPHDFLHHLPFHALHGPSGYVMDEFTVSYAPSATVFALCSRREGACSSGGLVFGLPDRLAPHIGQEAETVAGVLPDSELFLSEAATEDVLRRNGPSARFIHISTHGLFRRDNPLFSAIRLGNSHLTLLDLYRLPLSAELVALSGCSTGLNVVVGGDELLGLMRGLLLAGANGVMVSLWDVNDRSTSRFMKCFYENLFHDSDKAKALQHAMRETRADYPHPYYWAPFVLAGRHTASER